MCFRSSSFIYLWNKVGYRISYILHNQCSLVTEDEADPDATYPKVSPEQKPVDEETDDNTVDNEQSKGEMNAGDGACHHSGD